MASLLFPRRILLLLGFAALLAVAGHTILDVEADEDAERARHEPSLVPDRVVLTWSGDPARSQAVTWRTSAAADDAIAEIALATDGPDFARQARQVETSTQKLKTDAGAALYHTAEFRDLEPETMYAYRVGDGSVWSEWNQFTTASETAKPLSFLYVGDAQNDILSMWSRLIREGYSRAPQADFIVHAGDLVNRSNRDLEWGEWFLAAGWIFRRLPSVATPGNHEYSRSLGGRQLSDHWRPQFAFPENGPAEVAETCYYLDIQGLRLVSLISNEKQEEQAAWLDQTLAEHTQRWTIVTHHHPLFSSASGRDNPQLREAWQPLYDKHGVDLVIQGHDHSYARSNLLKGENVQEGGTVYVVSVSGPKMYEVDRTDWMARSAEDTQLFQVIGIDGDILRYESYTARGILYDAFELEKRPDAPNLLKDLAPDSPERRRISID